MRKRNRIAFFLITLTMFISSQAYAYSIRHHLINMGKNLVEIATSPLYGTFVKGPRNIKQAYQYEVWGREKPEKRGLLRYKFFALWRAPGEEVKGIIDGLIGSIQACGCFLKEFISIFFSD
jgi:hypothetical protein